MASDRAEILALWEQGGLTRPWNDPDMDLRRLLECPAARVFVLQVGSDPIVGCVTAQWEGHRGWIACLAVRRESRGHGHGRELVEAAEAWLESEGAPAIQLLVREDNLEAGDFYEHLGYDRIPVVTYQKRLDGTTRG